LPFATVRHRTKVTKGPAPRPPGSPWQSSRPGPRNAGAPSAHPISSARPRRARFECGKLCRSRQRGPVLLDLFPLWEQNW